MQTCKIFFLLLFPFVGLVSADEGAVDTSVLRELLERRDQYSHIQTTVIQEKQVPSISDKLVSEGKLWLVPNESFRWELGSPTTDLAILSNDKVHVYDLKKLTYEKLKADSRSARPIMLLLGIGEDASYEGMLDNFNPTGVDLNQKSYTISFLPQSSIMKRVITELIITFDLETAFPREVHWTQKDGTKILTTFSKASFTPFNVAEVLTLPEQEFVKK